MKAPSLGTTLVYHTSKSVSILNLKYLMKTFQLLYTRFERVRLHSTILVYHTSKSVSTLNFKKVLSSRTSDRNALTIIIIKPYRKKVNNKFKKNLKPYFGNIKPITRLYMRI